MALVWSDAWVLLAAVYARPPKDRAPLVEAGDHLNHAILSKAEIDGGLRRLVAAGYLWREGRGGVALGPAGELLAAKIGAGGRGGHAWSVGRAWALAESELGVSAK